MKFRLLPQTSIATLACFLSLLLFAHRSEAALGDIVTKYGFAATSFTTHPTQPYIYATIAAQNAVAIINTNTLAIEDTVFVGSAPVNLTLSPDGSKAYIANSGSSFVVVMDTQSHAIINAFLMPQEEEPRDVVFGNQNRLFVLTGSTVYQMDATTGASSGPNVTANGNVYEGQLRISPDRNWLYYADQGLSPSDMTRYDVSAITAVKSQTIQTGGNGEDLQLNHSGNTICHLNGGTYAVVLYRTSDFATLGTLVTGPYPEAAAFSPDDNVLYASAYSQGGLQVFDTNTFLQTGKINGPETAAPLAVAPSGRYLFATYGGYLSSVTQTIVYDTNRVVAQGAVSRKTHGSVGYADIPLPLTGTPGIECRTGGPSNDYSIVVTFAGNVPTGANQQAQVTSGSAMIGSGGLSNGGAVTVSGNIVTIPLTNVSSGQTIQVQLSGIPNGATTTSMVIPMSVLVGDVNGDELVNSADATITRNESGQGVDATNFRADVNADGAINSADATIVRNNSGHGVTAANSHARQISASTNTGAER